MINIQEAIDNELLTESCSCAKHIFESPELTFADIRDAVKTAAKDALQIAPVQECVTAYITCKDGDFVISPNKPSIDGCWPLKDADSKMWKLPKQQRPCMDKTLKDIYGVVAELND